jgi:hypothetical protein
MYYSGDGGYDGTNNYSSPHGYQAYTPEVGAYGVPAQYQPQPPPVIRDVTARRNTRIETPTSAHFPQQGNSGIAQNF